jgi:hypothetical protein
MAPAPGLETLLFLFTRARVTNWSGADIRFAIRIENSRRGKVVVGGTLSPRFSLAM